MTNPTPGSVVLTATERVVFGQPAASAIATEAEMLDASRVMLIASKSLTENTDDIAAIEQALGDRHATCGVTIKMRNPVQPGPARSGIVKGFGNRRLKWL